MAGFFVKPTNVNFKAATINMEIAYTIVRPTGAILEVPAIGDIDSPLPPINERIFSSFMELANGAVPGRLSGF